MLYAAVIDSESLAARDRHLHVARPDSRIRSHAQPSDCISTRHRRLIQHIRRVTAADLRPDLLPAAPKPLYPLRLHMSRLRGHLVGSIIGGEEAWRWCRGSSAGGGTSST
ncbi:hypothetical protein [Oryza sativa Japonica Group]|uniref:Uncharacterized protein P0416D03.13 n=1 Tax=Oryza sativa subsp. japonica TaxID=39947 RepID=Q5ZDN7_ORYSJ|nr:hypothetical protein [Oryza sativa Japonica Group]